jgi:outer membrane PBP1 activator LpoA protein
MAEWFLTKLNSFGDLNDVKQREAVLTEIKIKFAKLTPEEATEIIANLDLSRLFHQLTSNDKYVF